MFFPSIDAFCTYLRLIEILKRNILGLEILSRRSSTGLIFLHGEFKFRDRHMKSNTCGVYESLFNFKKNEIPRMNL
jgi:hypothetical protein